MALHMSAGSVRCVEKLITFGWMIKKLLLIKN
jgi:hypothetical protein